MFPTCQQVADGVKLWTVTHQLVDSLHLCQHTENQRNTQFHSATNTNTAAVSSTTDTTANTLVIVLGLLLLLTLFSTADGTMFLNGTTHFSINSTVQCKWYTCNSGLLLVLQ